MKRSILDRFIGFISPKLAYDRARFSAANELLRGYEAASISSTNDWSTAVRSSANSETRTSTPITRDRVRDLVRNNAYANRAVNVIVSNTVGAGIQAKIAGRTKTQEKQITQKWKEWSESNICSRDGKYNFYGMQAAALRCIVESGEVLAKKVVYNGYCQLQLLEPDYINANYNNDIDNVQGIWLDKNQNIVAYELYSTHPGDWRGYLLKSNKVSAADVIHAYRVERIGQLRGVPWAAPVVNALKDFSDFQNATLIRQKVAACVTAFVTEKEGDNLMDRTALKAKRELENSLEPASIRYLAPGQTMELASPPGVDQYDPFARQTLRSAAVGFGISYESISGDYSQVNFSSGRMGHLEMQRNIDMWRWQMLIPMFCEPSFKWFLTWLQIQGIDTKGVTVQWTPPAREMIDPTKEISALKDEVRSGFKSLPEAIRERGLDPQMVLTETAEFNTQMDDLKITYDSDPRKVTQQGMNQMAPPGQSPNGENGSENQKNASDKPGSSGSK